LQTFVDITSDCLPHTARSSRKVVLLPGGLRPAYAHSMTATGVAPRCSRLAGLWRAPAACQSRSPYGFRSQGGWQQQHDRAAERPDVHLVCVCDGLRGCVQLHLARCQRRRARAGPRRRAHDQVSAVCVGAVAALPARQRRARGQELYPHQHLHRPPGHGRQEGERARRAPAAPAVCPGC